MPIVFQYGSNTSATRLNSADKLNGAASVIGVARTLDNYDLDFTVWSITNKCAAADIVPDGNTQIWGVLYEIPENRIYRNLSGDKKSLDAIEGEGTNYKRIKIQVLPNKEPDKIITVITYVVLNRVQNKETSLEYASEIINRLKSHEIPHDYLEYVHNRIIQNNKALYGELPSLT